MSTVRSSKKVCWAEMLAWGQQGGVRHHSVPFAVISRFF